MSKPLGPLVRRDAQKKQGKALSQKKIVLVGVLGRQGHLLAKPKRLDELAKAGLASQVFGGGLLAGQAGSVFKSKASWSKAWSEAREQAWLFEGDKATSGANKSVKMDLERGLLRIALTQG